MDRIEGGRYCCYDSDYPRGCLGCYSYKGGDQRYQIAAWVGVSEGVIEDVAVAVVALDVAFELDEGVGADEAAYRGVVDAAVHVDELEGVEHFVPGKAAVARPCVVFPVGVGAPVVGLDALAPGVVGEFVFSYEGVVDGGDEGAEVIVEEEAYFTLLTATRGGLFGVGAEDAVGAGDVVAADGAGDAAFGEFFEFVAADHPFTAGDVAFSAVCVDAAVGGVVGEVELVVAVGFVDGTGFAEAGPVDVSGGAAVGFCEDASSIVVGVG